MMDACSDPNIPEVVIMSGAQLGKSEAILNILGYYIDTDPCPIMLMQPTVEMAQAFSKDRVAAGLLNSTPCLRNKVKDPRSRDSGNTTLHKVFAGGAITMVGANSPAGLASRPIRVLLCDEVDRYPMSAGTEGDPISLARKRTQNYFNRKVILVSTPTNKGGSRIETAFNQSDQRHYYVPCPHCKNKQVLKWSNVVWDEGIPETARYTCDACGSTWSEADRLKAVKNGEWVAHEEFKGVAGFFINALYSPWAKLSDHVREFLNVKKNPEMLRVFCNTVLGELWEDQGERVDDLDLAERREELTYLPEEALIITAGVDVQPDRLEASVIAWGDQWEAWVVDHVILYGDAAGLKVWQQLDALLARTYETVDGRELPISATCVDSGGANTQTVYEYCKPRYGRRVFAIKGVGGEARPLVGKPAKNNSKKCPLFPIGTDTAKDLLFSRLKIEDEGAGYVHFSDTLPDEYFKQLTGEKVVTKYLRGFAKRQYVKFRRNEALDCFVYSLASATILNVNFESLALRREREGRKPTTQEVKPKRALARPRSNFVNSWK